MQTKNTQCTLYLTVLVTLFLILGTLLLCMNITTSYAKTYTQSTVIQKGIKPAIIVEEGYPKEKLDGHLSYFYQLPIKIQKRIVNDGWTFVFCNNIIEEHYKVTGVYKKDISGFAILPENLIYIGNNEYYSYTIIHEIGHAITYTLGRIEYENEFPEIYKKERGILMLYYDVPNEQEYFAVAFREFFINPDALRIKFPKTYWYIENAIEWYTLDF